MHGFKPGDLVRHRPSGDRGIVVVIDAKQARLRVVHLFGDTAVSWPQDVVELVYRRKISGWDLPAAESEDLDQVG
jgi:hypothetical protein